MPPARCLACRRPLDPPDAGTDTADCGGGDCLRCMAEIGEDPAAVAALAQLTRNAPDSPPQTQSQDT